MKQKFKQLYFGVVGNMGPEADVSFQDCIRKASVEHLNALSDQEHINMTIVKNSLIPDRSKAINESGITPVPEILESLKKLEKIGVSYAVMPCNTAHYFKDEIQKKTNIHILDMPEATAQAIKQYNPQSIVGVLATTGTCNMKIYDKYLMENGIAFLKPNQIEQERYVHSAIYGNKTGEKDADGQDIREPNGLKSAVYEKNANLLIEMIDIFIKQGCDTVLLGCTELPLVEHMLKEKFYNIKFFNPMVCTAEKAVKIFNKANEKLIHKNVVIKSLLLQHKNLKTIDEISDYVAAKTLVNESKKAKIKIQLHKVMPTIKSLNCLSSNRINSLNRI